MNVESAIANLNAVWRTERIIANIRLNYLLASVGLKVFAALFAVFGLLLFELAAYFTLVHVWSGIISAIMLGLFNFLLAGTLLMLAIKRPLPRELALATEVQNSAVAALQVEARAFQAGTSGPSHHPWERALAVLLPRVIPIVIRALKRARNRPAPAEEA